MPTSPAHDPTSPAFVSAVGRALIEFLDGQSELASLTDTLPLLEAARVYAAGGKRLRPAFCYWGYVAAAGRPSQADERAPSPDACNQRWSSAVSSDRRNPLE